MTTPNGVDIENTANQIVHQYDPTNRNITKPEKPTQKRVVNLPVPLEFDFTKKLDGRNLVENEFTFVLKKDGVAIQTAKNSAPDATTGIAKILPFSSHFFEIFFTKKKRTLVKIPFSLLHCGKRKFCWKTDATVSL